MAKKLFRMMLCLMLVFGTALTISAQNSKGIHYKESYNPYWKCMMSSDNGVGSSVVNYIECITSKYDEGYEDGYNGKQAKLREVFVRLGTTVIKSEYSVRPADLSYSVGYSDGQKDRAKERN